MDQDQSTTRLYPSPPTGPLPVFFDERKRRWTHTKTMMPVVLLALAAVTAGFVLSLIYFPLLGGQAPTAPRAARANLNPVKPIIESKRTTQSRLQYHTVIRQLRQFLVTSPHRSHRTDAWKPATKPFSIVAGFYSNWDSSSWASFEKHASQLTHVIPEKLHLSADGQSLITEPDPHDQFPRLLALSRQYGVAVLPLLNNYVSGATGGGFDPTRIHRLVSSAMSRSALTRQLLAFVRRNNCQGVNIDLEEAADEDAPGLVAFVREVARQFHSANLLVTVDVTVDAEGLPSMAAAADYVIPMLYDQHDDTSQAGPIAAQQWFINRLEEFYAQVPPARTIVGIGNYAYDWPAGQSQAQDLSVGEAVVTAKESEGNIQLDPGSLNSHFDYYDDVDHPHSVWILDALSAFNQVIATRRSPAGQPAGAALWVIGSEDRAIWSFYGAGKLTHDPDPSLLSYIPGDYQVDAKGAGEILTVTAAASYGQRSLDIDPSTHLIRSEKYLSYPSPWVVHGRPTNRIPKTLAISFDDGPDGYYTPRMLDELSRLHAPATFFVIGDNADAYPELVKREWQEGHEVGNHTFFHPNLTLISEERLRLETEATERLLEVLIGRSPRLFRAPYDVDSDPDTPEEIKPLITISNMGMVTVGANIDPKDYERGRTARQIADDIIQHRDDGNIILMHDAGGDRSATIEALHIFIPVLRQMGYRFVPVTDLLSPPGQEARTRAEFYPLPSERSWSHTSDYMAFMAYFWGRRLLTAVFTLAIALGLFRVLFIGVLALIQARREKNRVFDPAYQPSVSVLVAAFNEEKVIRRTVEAVLQSDYPNFEVIVLDDGSSDRTAQVVRDAFAEDPRLRVCTKSNGGKASALNLGLQLSSSDIIVGIDADTLLSPDAIGKLARHFQDETVGAVAGNVQVGNPINLLTRWQSLEYITGQNFDRRAYDLLNCITVVPGAVGAWRRSRLLELGGYLSDTLAEDTDLTYRLRLSGAVIRTESLAVGYTEAPETLRDFQKQRLRWSFGTLQCLWKHRHAMLKSKYGTFGWIALPSLWFYSILLPLISPVMDFMIIWSLFDIERTFARTAFYYGIFFLAELVSALTALYLDGDGPGLAFWLFLQRFFYRQLMYQIVWRAIMRAWAGSIHGWGKLNRTGSVQSGPGVPGVNGKTPPKAASDADRPLSVAGKAGS